MSEGIDVAGPGEVWTFPFQRTSDTEERPTCPCSDTIGRDGRAGKEVGCRLWPSRNNGECLDPLGE